MAAWPTISDAKLFIGQPITSYDDERLQSVLDAATQVVSDDIGVQLIESNIKPNVREAILLLTGRLYSRKDTPLGVQGFSGDQVVYIMRHDPDVMLLLQREFTNWPIG